MDTKRAIEVLQLMQTKSSLAYTAIDKDDALEAAIFALESELRPCALCGHARIDHEHSHTEHTWCLVDMGGESHEMCPCASYEAQP